MRINIAIYLGVFLFVASCNNSKQNNPSSSDKKLEGDSGCYLLYDHSGYPIDIDSLHLRKEYDKAKWWLYCFYCDRPLKFLPDASVKDTLRTMGQLDLKYEYKRKDHDTMLIYFDFYYGTMKYNSRVAVFSDLTGVKITMGNDSVIALSNGTTDFWDGPKSRLGSPLQPEVIKYIRANKDKIDPWFYQEAKKRGVFDSTLQ